MSLFRRFVLALPCVLVACGASSTAVTSADVEADVTTTDVQATDTTDTTDTVSGTDAIADSADVDSGGTDATGETDSQSGTDAIADTSDGAQPDVIAPDVAGDPADTVNMNVCQKLGGICASNSTDCTTGGGTYQPNGDTGCVFDDGPGACCIPPKMTQSTATCADFGGICAPISGCNFVQGAYAAFEGCKGIPMICCVPHDICGDENESCCDNMTTYRTACDPGAWICTIDGTVKKPTDQCPK